MEIYKVAEQYRALKNLLNSEGEEADGLREAVEEAFTELMQDQANGAEVAVQVIREAEALSAAVKLEIDRLAILLKSRNDRIDRAKNAVRLSMIATDTQSIETTLGKFSLRMGSEKAVVHDEAALIQLSIDDELCAQAVKIEVVRKAFLPEVKRLIKENLIPESIAALVRGDKTLTLK